MIHELLDGVRNSFGRLVCLLFVFAFAVFAATTELPNQLRRHRGAAIGLLKFLEPGLVLLGIVMQESLQAGDKLSVGLGGQVMSVLRIGAGRQGDSDARDRGLCAAC